MKKGPEKAVHDVSLKRPDGYYMVDNEMVEVFAPVIGIYAFGVYHLLKARAFKKESERAISLQGISQAMGISKDSAAAAVATLRKVGLVTQYSSASVNAPPRYEVAHAKDVLAENPDFARLAQEHTTIRTLTRPKRGRNAGRAADGMQDADSRKSGRRHTTFRTPNKEEGIEGKKERKQDTPLPPSRGGGDEAGDPEPGREEVLRRVQAVLGHGAAARLTRGGALTQRELKKLRMAARVGAGCAERVGPETTLAGFISMMAGGVDDPLARGEHPRTLAGQAPEHDLPMDLRVRAAFNGALEEVRRALLDASLAMGPSRPEHLRDGAADWKDCFADVALEGFEAAEGSAARLALTVETGNPRKAEWFLRQYAGRMSGALKKFFGTEPQIVVRARGG